MDLCLIHTGIMQGLLDWLKGTMEQVSVQLLEAGTGDGRVEAILQVLGTF